MSNPLPSGLCPSYSKSTKFSIAMAASTLLPVTFLLATTLLFFQAHAATKPAPVAAAPAPTPQPLNLTAILEKGSQFTTFQRLLKETQIGNQIENQLNNSFGGMTIFAPTDNAFNGLKSGTLNKLTEQEQAALMLYHVLPRYYSLETFQTTSNPITTQATGNHGAYVVNVTSGSNQVNVSTGVNDVPVNNALYSSFPLAVYEVDSVLLPYDLFGPKPPPSPPPKPAPKVSTKKAPSSSNGGSVAADSTSTSAASIDGWRVGWTSVAGIGLMSIGMILL